MSSKLQSLQGLRGLAIILVLIFHLFPTRFVNGFVGVDMFFVLSGYLMTRILSRSISFRAVLDFYRKRFIRIIPLYYLTILATIIGVLWLVLMSERDDFIYDVFWALPLVSNIQPIFEHHTYWQQVSSIRYLTHLWSLCTELQYYLIAPAIQFIATQLSFYNRLLGYTTAILIFFVFQLLAPFEYSYCFLASRVWQFLLGSCAYELEKRNDTWVDMQMEDAKKHRKRTFVDVFPLVFIALLAACLALPRVFGENSTRLTISLVTTCFCFLCGKLEKTMFTFPPLVFIGDVSYVMYLLHWPVINFVRYIQQRDHSEMNVPEAIVSVVIILGISSLAHFYLEKNLLNLEFPSAFTLSLFVLALSYSLTPLLRTQQCFAIQTLPPDLRERVQFNLNSSNLLVKVSQLPCDVTEKTANLSIDLFGIEYCAHYSALVNRHKTSRPSKVAPENHSVVQKSNGNGTILIIGNSLSIRAFPVVFEMLDGRYEEIRLFAKHGGAPLFNIFDYYTETARRIAEEVKPDVLWIIQGIQEIIYPENPLTTFDPEYVDKVVMEKMDEFKVLARMVYVDLPYFITREYPAKLLARSLIYQKDFEEKLSVTMESVEEQIGQQTERLLSLNCSNCYFNDVQKALTDGNDKFYLYERDTYRVLNYDGRHLSLEAFKRIKPIYQERIYQFLNFTEQF